MVMRYALLVWMLLVLVCASCITVTVKDSVIGTPVECKPVLRHVVLFKFKPDAPPEKVRELEASFKELPKKIAEIEDFEWGRNIGAEERSEGFTHCFLVTFADQSGLDAYLPHPAHQEYVEQLKPYLEKVLVVDYFSQQ